jgi:hypothetical protein
VKFDVKLPARYYSSLTIFPLSLESITTYIVRRSIEGSLTRIQDKNHVSSLITKPQRIARIFEKWQSTGKNIPFAIAPGTPPVVIMAASMHLPAHCTEDS